MREEVIAAALDRILVREGWPQYSNRAADRGGPTKGGITLRTFSEWLGRPATISQLKAMSEETARTIYRQRYLAPWEWIPDEDGGALFAVLVDYAVTSWHDDPTRALQTAVNVTVDGKLGPITRAAVLAADPDTLRSFVIGYRVRHMVDLAFDAPMRRFLKAHPEAQMHNLRGWINRVTEFL